MTQGAAPDSKPWFTSPHVDARPDRVSAIAGREIQSGNTTSAMPRVILRRRCKKTIFVKPRAGPLIITAPHFCTAFDYRRTVLIVALERISGAGTQIRPLFFFFKQKTAYEVVR